MILYMKPGHNRRERHFSTSLIPSIVIPSPCCVERALEVVLVFFSREQRKWLWCLSPGENVFSSWYEEFLKWCGLYHTDVFKPSATHLCLSQVQSTTQRRAQFLSQFKNRAQLCALGNTFPFCFVWNSFQSFNPLSKNYLWHLFFIFLCILQQNISLLHMYMHPTHTNPYTAQKKGSNPA